jgi:hypothetical protein
VDKVSIALDRAWPSGQVLFMHFMGQPRVAKMSPVAEPGGELIASFWPSSQLPVLFVCVGLRAG